MSINGTNPNISPGKRFFYIWGPVLIHQIGLLVTEMIALTAMLMYQASHNEKVMSALTGLPEELYDILVKMMNQHAVLITGIGCLVMIPVFIHMFRRDRRDYMLTHDAAVKKEPFKNYLFLAVLVMAVHYVLNNVIILSNAIAQVESYEQVSEMLYAPGLPMQIIVLGILAPLCEELVYRGLVFKRLRQHNSFLSASLLSALVFGVIHGNLVQMLYAFALGLLLAFAYEKFGSVLVPIAAHSLLNLISIAGTEAGVYDIIVRNTAVFMATTVAAAGIGAFMFLLIKNGGGNDRDSLKKSEENHTLV